jgi:periplasmic divalent cation tolerance protein
MDTLIVVTTVGDRETALKIARHLIDGRLAACVNVLAPCTSVYRWQGKTEEAQEIPLLIKTHREAYPAVEAAIREMHPYELPEIVAVPVERGLPAYLEWVASETTIRQSS